MTNTDQLYKAIECLNVVGKSIEGGALSKEEAQLLSRIVQLAEAIKENNLVQTINIGGLTYEEIASRTSTSKSTIAKIKRRSQK